LEGASNGKIGRVFTFVLVLGGLTVKGGEKLEVHAEGVGPVNPRLVKSLAA